MFPPFLLRLDVTACSGPCSSLLRLGRVARIPYQARGILAWRIILVGEQDHNGLLSRVRYHLSKVCSLAGSASDISRFHGSLVRSIQRKVLAMVRKYSIRSMPAQANIRDASHCLASLLDGDSRFI